MNNMSLMDDETLGSLVGERIRTPSGNHLLLTAALGRGAHGSVYYALALPHQQVCAVKCIEYGHLTSARQRKLQRLEASLHAKCSSIPGVLNLYEVGDLPDLDAWYLVMDVAERGDLFDALDSGSIFSGCRDRRSREHLVQHLFLQVLETVRACHARGVYHRDLKPENFLLSSDPCQGGLPKLLLADFGLATDRTISSEYGCGSAFYMAPEAHPDATRPYKPAATDVWSLGILLINLVCQRNPWRRASPSDASYALHVEKYPHGLAELLPFTPTFSTVLARALDPNPETRATLSEFQETLMACPFPWYKPSTLSLDLHAVPTSTTTTIPPSIPKGSDLGKVDQTPISPPYSPTTSMPDLISGTQGSYSSSASVSTSSLAPPPTIPISPLTPTGSSSLMDFCTVTEESIEEERVEGVRDDAFRDSPIQESFIDSEDESHPSRRKPLPRSSTTRSLLTLFGF